MVSAKLLWQRDNSLSLSLFKRNIVQMHAQHDKNITNQPKPKKQQTKTISTTRHHTQINGTWRTIEVFFNGHG